MKILFFVSLCKNISGNIFGGAEKTIVNLANWLSECTENQIYLISVQGTERPFEIYPNVHFKGFDIKFTNKIQLNWEIFKNIYSSIKTIRPDILVTFEIYPLLYSLLNKIINKRFELLYSERNDPKIHYSLLQRIIRNISLFFVDGVICQTQDALKYFPERIRRKSKVIHNPVYIPYDKYPIPVHFDNRIVAVGRLNKQKNYPLLINAFHQISNKYPKLILEIYGEGVERERLQSQIESLNLNERIFLRGAHRNVIDLIYGARLFIMTSLYEGMPNALMEAMCLGIPVICSDCPCGGPNELIQTGKNGFLFENDNLGDLIKKIEISLSLEKPDISKNEKMISYTHSVDHIFSQWYNFLKSKINK